MRVVVDEPWCNDKAIGVDGPPRSATINLPHRHNRAPSDGNIAEKAGHP